MIAYFIARQRSCNVEIFQIYRDISRVFRNLGIISNSRYLYILGRYPLRGHLPKPTSPQIEGGVKTTFLKSININRRKYKLRGFNKRLEAKLNRIRSNKETKKHFDLVQLLGLIAASSDLKDHIYNNLGGQVST